MLADLLPLWLWHMLGMDRAVLPTDRWTWRHTWRYGRDPARIVQDYARWREHPYPRRTPWLFRGNNAQYTLMAFLFLAIIWLNW